MEPGTALPWEWHYPANHRHTPEDEEQLFQVGGSWINGNWDWDAPVVLKSWWGYGESGLDISEEDKAYIVHACNLHPYLERIEAAARTMREVYGAKKFDNTWLALTAALAEAETVRNLLDTASVETQNPTVSRES